MAIISWLAMVPLEAVRAQVPVKLYAQELVDRIVAQHPDLRAVAIHATPAKGGGNMIIASNIAASASPPMRATWR